MSDNYKFDSKDVAATVIEVSGHYIVARRSDNGDWEFPGGKFDRERDSNNEKPGILNTAEREIREELDLDIEALEYSLEDSYMSGGYNIIPVKAEIDTDKYDFTDQNLSRERVGEEILLEEHDDFRWYKPAENEELAEKLDEELRCLEAFDLI